MRRYYLVSSPALLELREQGGIPSVMTNSHMTYLLVFALGGETAAALLATPASQQKITITDLHSFQHQIG